MKEPLQYGRLACDTFIKKYAAPDLPPVKKFHYHQGVFLSGMEKIYYLTGDEAYAQYIQDWVDSIIAEDGSIHEYDPGMLDDIQPAILLFRLYETTRKGKYKAALKELSGVLDRFNQNPEGGFWHKVYHPDQMWLDGLYMAGPLEAQLGAKFDEPDRFDICVRQAFLMKQHMTSSSGLLYHAWDYSHSQPWADEKTGCSAEVWGRALGWYVVSVLDILDYLPKWHKARQELIEIEYHLLKNLINYQDADSGLWYQVVDKPDAAGNWTELSCSCLFCAALFKAMRCGYVSDYFYPAAKKGFCGVIDALSYDHEVGIEINRVCIGTDVCDYDGYIARPCSTNDLHGAGAFLIMCAECAEYEMGQKNN